MPAMESNEWINRQIMAGISKVMSMRLDRKKKKKMAIDASLGQSIKLKKMVILLLQIDAGIPPTF